MPASWHQAPLFASLKPDQLWRLEDLVVSKRFAQGQDLFGEGDPCSGFFVLVEGVVQLTKNSPNPSVCPALALVQPIQSFAEAALFGGGTFPATATAVKPCQTAFFPREAFLRALRDSPDLALALLHAQSVWLRRITEQMERVSGQDSHERLGRWLRENLPAGRPVRLPVSKKALAVQLGMSPETLSRSLRTLQDRGWLRVDGAVLTRLGK